MKEPIQEITQEDIDRIVALSENDPKLKNDLQQLDLLANKRGIELKDVIQTACSLYYVNKVQQEIKNINGKKT